jgi:hypothetical protein
VVLGGLFTSTALTLVVLPAFYPKFGKIFLPKKAIAVVDNRKAIEAVLKP